MPSIVASQRESSTAAEAEDPLADAEATEAATQKKGTRQGLRKQKPRAIAAGVSETEAPASWETAGQSLLRSGLDELGNQLLEVHDVVRRIDSLLSSFRNEALSHRGELQARFDVIHARLDSIEKRIPMMEEIATIRARLAEVENKLAAVIEEL